jgi:hypothetical protein
MYVVVDHKRKTYREPLGKDQIFRAEYSWIPSVAHDITGNTWKFKGFFFWMDRKRRIPIASRSHLAKSRALPVWFLFLEGRDLHFHAFS